LARNGSKVDQHERKSLLFPIRGYSANKPPRRIRYCPAANEQKGRVIVWNDPSNDHVGQRVVDRYIALSSILPSADKSIIVLGRAYRNKKPIACQEKKMKKKKRHTEKTG
jgi:hypothetical protein